MKRLALALLAMTVAASPALAGIEELDDIVATIVASSGDQDRVLAGKITTGTVFGIANATAASTLRIGLYASINGTQWFPLANTSMAAGDSAITSTISAAGTHKIAIPLWKEWTAGTVNYRELDNLHYPRLKVVVTNTGAVTVTGVKFWIVYN